MAPRGHAIIEMASNDDTPHLSAKTKGIQGGAAGLSAWGREDERNLHEFLEERKRTSDPRKKTTSGRKTEDKENEHLMPKYGEKVPFEGGAGGRAGGGWKKACKSV